MAARFRCRGCKTDTENVSETLEGCPNLKVDCSPCQNDEIHEKTSFWQGLQSTFIFGNPSNVFLNVFSVQNGRGVRLG